MLSCAVSCNQSLAAILTCQMCDTLYPSREDLALAYTPGVRTGLTVKMFLKDLYGIGE